MDGTSTKAKTLEMLSNALRGIHLQLAALQQQEATMARALSAITRKIDGLNVDEEGLACEVDNIDDDVSQVMAAAHIGPLCPACGGPLERHPAACGDLLICTACGFSEFVDGSGIVSTTSLPPPPPIPDSPGPLPSWVG